MWDGHNSTSWNSAICAWALVNSYAALRDRGDSIETKYLTPYWTSMMNNLCSEICQFGSIPSGPGFRDLTYAILEGLLKIDKAEKIRHPDWEKAAKILWNSGILQTGQMFTVNVGQYLLWKTDWNYSPRHAQK